MSTQATALRTSNAHGSEPTLFSPYRLGDLALTTAW